MPGVLSKLGDICKHKYSRKDSVMFYHHFYFYFPLFGGGVGMCGGWFCNVIKSGMRTILFTMSEDGESVGWDGGGFRVI